MGLQIWHPADIENMLWAIQTIIQASECLLERQEGSIIYHQGFKQGTEITLAEVLNSIENKFFTQEIWSRADVEDALLAAHVITQSKMQTRIIANSYNQGCNYGFEVTMWSIALAFGVNLLGTPADPSSKRNPMTSPDPLFSDDIHNFLMAIQIAMQATIFLLNNIADPVAYLNGFEVALNYIAKSFGTRLLLPLNSPSSGNKHTFRSGEDIKNKLFMIHKTVPPELTETEHSHQVRSHWQGFEAALSCIAIAFGKKFSTRFSLPS